MLDPRDPTSSRILYRVARGQLRLVSTVSAAERARLPQLFPFLCPKVQLRLARDPFNEVRHRLSSYPRLSPAAQLVLLETPPARASSFYSVLAGNPFLSEEAGEFLWEKGDSRIRSALTRSTSVPNLLSRVRSEEGARSLWQQIDMNPSVAVGLEYEERYGLNFRNLAASNWYTPRALFEELVRYPDLWERLAENPALPGDLLEPFAHSDDQRVLRRVARHPNLPLELADVARARLDLAALRYLAGNDSLSGKYLEELHRLLPEAKLGSTLMSNRSTPPALLAELARSADKRTVFHLLKNPALSESVLFEVSVTALDPVQLAAFACTSPHWETLEVLGREWSGTLGELLAAGDLLA